MPSLSCPEKDKPSPQASLEDNKLFSKERAVSIACLLTGSFMLIEIIGGLISGSLALLADAAHMLTDTVSLSMAWWAFWLTRHPTDHRLSFGRHRLPVLVAFGNALALILLSVWIFAEAIKRLMAPLEILTGPMLAVACAGLLVNIVAFWILHRSERHNLNMRAAMLHVLGDLLGSVAAISAALIIMVTGWGAADPLLSVLVALLILRNAWHVMRDSAHILLEGAPASHHPEEIAKTLKQEFPEINRVHHLHLWSLDEERIYMTAEIVIAQGESLPADQDTYPELSEKLKAYLTERFNILHTTLEITLSPS